MNLSTHDTAPRELGLEIEMNQPILGQRNISEIFSDFKLFEYVVTPGRGSRTLSDPGYGFVSMCPGSFQKRNGKEYCLYAKPTQEVIDAANPYCMEGGLNSFEIIVSPYWTEQGVALVVGVDKVMIARPWIATIPLDQLPQPSEMNP